MPRGDRSGPDGRGPRGGTCVGAGQDRGFGYARGNGRSMGRGAGRGFGRGFAGAYPINQPSEKEALESRTQELERELALLKAKLGQNSENSES